MNRMSVTLGNMASGSFKVEIKTNSKMLLNKFINEKL